MENGERMKKKKALKSKPGPRGILDLVLEIQTERPGWRFLLLGGDNPFGWKRIKSGELKKRNGGLIVDKKKREPFGWKAEFFGHENPEKNTGQRIVQTGFYVDPYDAVLIACAAARKAINDGVE